MKAECSVYFLTQERVVTSINIFDGGNDDFLQDLDDNLIYRRVKPLRLKISELSSRFSQLISLDFTVEGRAVYPQYFRAFFNIPLIVVKHLDDVRFFNLLKGIVY